MLNLVTFLHPCMFEGREFKGKLDISDFTFL